MNTIKTIVAFLLLFVCTNSIAQSTNTQKIIGCWKITKFEFKTKTENSSELIKDVINTEICFDSKGNFTTKKVKEKSIVYGKFNLSEDGKTLFQSSHIENNDLEEIAEIEVLNEKTLIIKGYYFTLIFEKK
jgi:hypothetical protein